MSTADSILELRDLRVARGAEWSVELSELVLRAKETAALVGPSGCGKTTVLLGWAGLLPGLTLTGERRVLGATWPVADTSEWREMLAGPVTVLLQDAKAALDPLQRVGVQIATVTDSTADDRRQALRSLGLDDAERILHSHPHELSGGQAQKILLAIAWLRAPKLLIADEPTAGLDGESIGEFVAGLKVLRERHDVAVLLATHDIGLVEAVGASVYQHRDGRFQAVATAVTAWPERERDNPNGVVLSATGIHKSFGSTSVLRGVSLEIDRGEIVAIVGPSGCGKSTLAMILTGHLAPDRGQVSGPHRRPESNQEHGVSEDAGPAMEPPPARQLLFQDAFASLTPHRTIRSLIDETRVEAFDVAAESAAIGLPTDRLDHRATELSGGERRRAALLRALSVDPPVIVLDEPTASLDHESALNVMEMILAVQRRRRLACVLITHDAEMARAYAHRVLELRDGRLS